MTYYRAEHHLCYAPFEIGMRKRLLLITLLCLPAAAWAFIKPVRIAAPEPAGLSCLRDTLCIDDISRYPAAASLYDDALHFIASSIAPIKNKPRVIFCSTMNCLRSFGFEKQAGANLGTFGIIISPRGWKPYYVRHEMIHHLQNERLGTFSPWLLPNWFSEGMAYSLSLDPRPKLAEPFQQYRSRFDDWYSLVGKERLWSVAKKL
ncbi:MAG: hypothetical protein ACU836_01425 [Gammaproteobacteria bacterium]